MTHYGPTNAYFTSKPDLRLNPGEKNTNLCPLPGSAY